MDKPKIIALYLPQFHCIPENDEFWGKGFTDWETVKKAKPIYEGHDQPKVPMGENYYDLSLKENVEWQSNLAKENGIYGFGVYHYWFNNEKNILTKPAEILCNLKDNPVKYFFVWDNCNWKRSWSNVVGNDWAPVVDGEKNKKGQSILIPYILGEEADWENHYRNISHHFKSDNYEKKNNKPVFCIIWYSKEIQKMCEYWDKLAKEDGYDGMFFVLKNNKFGNYPKGVFRYDYEPHNSSWLDVSFRQRIIGKLVSISKIKIPEKLCLYDYDLCWQKLLKRVSECKDETLIPGAFVSYDDSPRRGNTSAKIIVNGTPEKFQTYFSQLYDLCKIQKKDYIFLTAWNEWGEGAYLEPDIRYGYAYLNAIKNIVL